MSAWIQHVKAYAKKNGVSYKEAMKGASKTYGSGINEDRIKANIAKRKAVAEKRDDAQSFLSNIAQKAKELPQKKLKVLNPTQQEYIKKIISETDSALFWIDLQEGFSEESNVNNLKKNKTCVKLLKKLSDLLDKFKLRRIEYGHDEEPFGMKHWGYWNQEAPLHKWSKKSPELIKKAIEEVTTILEDYMASDA